VPILMDIPSKGIANSFFLAILFSLYLTGLCFSVVYFHQAN
jgi:hypothetical protein